MDSFLKLAQALAWSGFMEKIAKLTEPQILRMLQNPNLPADQVRYLNNQLENIRLGRQTGANVRQRRQIIADTPKKPGRLASLTPDGRVTNAVIQSQYDLLAANNREADALANRRGSAASVRAHSRAVDPSVANQPIKQRLEAYRQGTYKPGPQNVPKAPQPGFFGSMLKKFPGGGKGALIGAGGLLAAGGLGYAMSGQSNSQPQYPAYDPRYYAQGY